MSSAGELTPSMRGPAWYRIRVRGRLEAGEIDQIGDFRVEPSEETVLVGRVADQAALSGLLNALYECQLPVISIECLNRSTVTPEEGRRVQD